MRRRRRGGLRVLRESCLISHERLLRDMARELVSNTRCCFRRIAHEKTLYSWKEREKGVKYVQIDIEWEITPGSIRRPYNKPTMFEAGLLFERRY
jgi:hypothetical protein